jgi:hypothetical protein
VHIAEYPLNGVGPRTVRREPEELKPRVTGHPLLNGFGFMNTLVICDDINTSHT